MALRDQVSTIGLSLVAAGAMGVAAYVHFDRTAPGPAPREVFLSVCEAALSERLVAPSTYARLEAGKIVRRPASYAEARGLFSASAEDRHLKYLESGDDRVRALEVDLREIYERNQPDLAEVVIRYEAQNALGVPLQATAICAQLLDRGAPLDAPRNAFDNTFIDGQTNLEWAFKRR